MKIGVHSWVLETHYSLPEAFKRAAQIGYDGYEVDIGNFGGSGLGLQILPDRMSDANREEIRKAREEAQIEICSLCLGALWHYPLAGNNEEYRRRGVEITKAAVGLAGELKADVILLPLGQPEGVSENEAWSNTLRSIDECLNAASEARITLALENVCSRFLLTASDLAKMVDEFSSPFLKVYYDVANNTWMGMDPVAEILTLGSRICRFHFKNRSSYRGSENSVTNSVGEPGIVKFTEVSRAVQEIGFNGYIVVEVPTLGLDADEVALRNLKELQSLGF